MKSWLDESVSDSFLKTNGDFPGGRYLLFESDVVGETLALHQVDLIRRLKAPLADGTSAAGHVIADCIFSLTKPPTPKILDLLVGRGNECLHSGFCRFI